MHARQLNRQFQPTMLDKMAKVRVSGDELNFVVDAGLGDQRIGKIGFKAIS